MPNNTRVVRIGNVQVGGGAPVSIQSMTNTDTRDAGETLRQIRELARNGCEIVRCAVPDQEAAEALRLIVAASPVPVVADIHFDCRLALAALRNGVHAVRINPGNIRGEENLRRIVEAARERGVPIRVGANSGSVDPALLERCRREISDPGDAMAEALCESALEQCRILEKYDFHQIKVSLKSSSVPVTVKAYRRFSRRADYPLHIGITEAGTPCRGIIKSAVGIGALLLDGIGDTLRVSLTASPVDEVIAARRILESCELREAKPELVSCPTCGRTQIDLISLAESVEKLIDELKNDGYTIDLKKIAVMGCVVNGPGEARDADIGLAGGNGKVAVFRHGEVIGTFSESRGLEVLRQEILKSSRR